MIGFYTAWDEETKKIELPKEPEGYLPWDKKTYHQWEKYTGIVHVYDYCKACGTKKDDENKNGYCK